MQKFIQKITLLSFPSFLCPFFLLTIVHISSSSHSSTRARTSDDGNTRLKESTVAYPTQERVVKKTGRCVHHVQDPRQAHD